MNIENEFSFIFDREYPEMPMPPGSGYMYNFSGTGWEESEYFKTGNVEDKFYFSQNVRTSYGETKHSCQDDNQGGNTGYAEEVHISKEYKRAHTEWLHEGHELWLAHSDDPKYFYLWLEDNKLIWAKYKNTAKAVPVKGENEAAYNPFV
ncbi:hypothetical protein I6H07_06195 [Hafnia alvei]|nr:hypothetical protein [Hafnia alvei]MBI0275425.1 hypothetical protein [Hafnia alvei]PNK98582.1 hypothetical protein CEQ28_013805 [Hafnia alvei]